MTNSLQNLPPEMQARLQQIMATHGNQPESPHQAAIAQPQAAPIVKPPSLMDHVIQLRQEVAAMRHEVGTMTQQMQANSQVVEAVGQAVGEVYQMFQQSTNPSPEYHQEVQGAPTYSQGFAQAPVSQDDY